MTTQKPPYAAKVLLGLTIGFMVVSTLLTFGYRSKRQEAEKFQEKYENLQNEHFALSNRTDSLSKEASMLNSHRPLSLAMSHRDEATRHLKYAVGEAVYLKRDSTRVVITDIVIGGSAYNYYLRYRVVNRENREEEIIPELLFR
jgi:hypothetical protein